MWLTETPWPPILITLVAAVLLFAAWFSTRRGMFLVGAGLLVILCGAIYIVEQRIITEAERVEQLVLDLTSAFQQKREEQVLEMFSPTASELRATVKTAMNLVTVHEDLRITDLSVQMKAQDSRAISHFRANATISIGSHGGLGHHPSRWEITWQREADQWRIIRVERLNPVSGEPVFLFDQN